MYLCDLGVVINGPDTVIYFPGQGPIELECTQCNVSNGPIVTWFVDGQAHLLADIAGGMLANHDANGTNIIIEVPVNDTEYVCAAATSNTVTRSNPVYIYIAGKLNFKHYYYTCI